MSVVTFNAGEHYRNAITAKTYPFPPAALDASSIADDNTTYAPKCTREARNHLKTVVQLLVGPNELADFNEILSVAYMSGGKMNVSRFQTVSSVAARLTLVRLRSTTTTVNADSVPMLPPSRSAATR